MRQILILRYLTSVVESPDLMVHMYDQNVLGLILKFIDVDAANKDPRLSFEALKFLGALLCDTKFAVDFLYGQGLHRLIEVPRPSIAAVVRIFLIYLKHLFRTELILFEYYVFFFSIKGCRHVLIPHCLLPGCNGTSMSLPRACSAGAGSLSTLAARIFPRIRPLLRRNVLLRPSPIPRYS